MTDEHRTLVSQWATQRNRYALRFAAGFALAACAPPVNQNDASADATASDASVEASTEAGTEAGPGQDPVRIEFAARVGAMPFRCGQQFTNMGMTNTTWTPKDFRLYIHDVRLVTAAGESPVTLDTVPMFQGAGVAMLDFEDRTGACSEGTTETHSVVVGRAMAASVRGIRFKVGVPFMLNHRESSSAPAPLNASALWWTWNAGYRFLKIDGNTTGLAMGYNVHIGSTGCAGNATGPVNPCANPNVIEVSLDNYDPTRDNIVMDLAALLAQSNVDTNQAMSAPGCMSGADDMDCREIFGALGLPFAGMPAATQRFFRVEAR
ncbi:MAG: metallo-mystery pair system four-Cys motif protein [Deltaproteobacteria bacterium]|nr:metallo-mystery pair system four-Cys motif protein [Deltaproteobacteria bacterium]